MKVILITLSLMTATAANAQYRNLEARPNGQGGYEGTYGNQNFDTGSGNQDGAQIGGRRPGVVIERRSLRKGNVGATQRNCVTDSNGNAFCR